MEFFYYLSKFEETKESKKELDFLIKFKSKTLQIKNHKSHYNIFKDERKPLSARQGQSPKPCR